MQAAVRLDKSFFAPNRYQKVNEEQKLLYRRWINVNSQPQVSEPVARLTESDVFARQARLAVA